MSLFNAFRQRLATTATLQGVRSSFASRAAQAVHTFPAQQAQQRLQFHTIWRQRNITPRRVRNTRWNSSKPSPDPTPHLGSPKALSLSERMRKLSREYGWSAVGVYFALSALDFPFCFLAVRWLGTDRIAHWEHVIIEGFWKVTEMVMPNARQAKDAAVQTAEEVGVVSDPMAREGGAGWGVEEAQKLSKRSDASEWTNPLVAPS